MKMDKYRLYEKIIKTKACTYFRAECNATHQMFIVKKLHRSTTWDQILKDKDLTLMKNSGMVDFPTINEIVKEEDQFYIVMENMATNLEYLIKSDIDKESIYKIGRLLVQLACNLGTKGIHPREVRPVHIFLDQQLTQLRLTHLETVSKDIAKLDLVQLQDLRYLSPEQVLTSKDIDARSIVFNMGAILCDLILGRPLITASTKMQYMYSLTALFPDSNVGGSSQVPSPEGKQGDSFDSLIRNYNFSNEFIALLRQMLKIDRSERVPPSELLQAWDVVIENEANHARTLKAVGKPLVTQQGQHIAGSNANGVLQSTTDKQGDQDGICFDFEEKPTLSVSAQIKITTTPLAGERNVQDDIVQPLIIKKSRNEAKLNLKSTKASMSKSIPAAKPPGPLPRRKPQLTNYALNEANLGVHMAMNPSVFSETDI